MFGYFTTLYMKGLTDNHLRLTLAFMLNSALREKFNFCFQKFFAILTKLSFWQED